MSRPKKGRYVVQDSEVKEKKTQEDDRLTIKKDPRSLMSSPMENVFNLWTEIALQSSIKQEANQAIMASYWDLYGQLMMAFNPFREKT